MIVEEWQSGGGHCPQKRIGLDFEASSLSVAQLRLNADRGALTACSVGWYCEVLARRARRRCYLGKANSSSWGVTPIWERLWRSEIYGCEAFNDADSSKPMDTGSDPDYFGSCGRECRRREIDDQRKSAPDYYHGALCQVLSMLQVGLVYLRGQISTPIFKVSLSYWLHLKA